MHSQLDFYLISGQSTKKANSRITNQALIFPALAPHSAWARPRAKSRATRRRPRPQRAGPTCEGRTARRKGRRAIGKCFHVLKYIGHIAKIMRTFSSSAGLCSLSFGFASVLVQQMMSNLLLSCRAASRAIRETKQVI